MCGDLERTNTKHESKNTNLLRNTNTWKNFWTALTQQKLMLYEVLSCMHLYFHPLGCIMGAEFWIKSKLLGPSR